jgi:hypothetical protein
MNTDKRFIIWDFNRGKLPEFEDQRIVSDGIIGRVDEDNAFLTVYPEYTGRCSHCPHCDTTRLGTHATRCQGASGKITRKYTELELNEWVEAKYAMSGTSGVYRIYRVA